MIAGVPAGVEVRSLEYRSDLASRVVKSSIRLAVDSRLSRRGRNQPEQNPQRGRLSGSVGSEEAGDRGRPDGEVQVIDRNGRPEVLPKSLDDDLALGHPVTLKGAGTECHN